MRDEDGAHVEDVDVLHVSEAFGGGVQTAISRYVENSPDLKHALVVRVRKAHDVGTLLNVRTTRCEGSTADFVRIARAEIRRVRPKIVHLHSSIAGALRVFSFPGVKIVYTPHSYSFLRNDISAIVRAGYFGAELVLSRRAHTIAAISPHEAATASRLTTGASVVTYLPNVAGDQAARTVLRSHKPSAVTHVIAVGRIAAQKDPTYFARVAERVVDRSIEWTWIGDGDPDLKKELSDAGVTVTGWLSNAETLEMMADADLYFHSARWEGAPMTLLEAAQVGTPVLVREVETLRGLGFAFAGTEVEESAESIMRFAQDVDYRERIRAISALSLEIHSSAVQREALAYLYDLPVGGGK